MATLGLPARHRPGGLRWQRLLAVLLLGAAAALVSGTAPVPTDPSEHARRMRLAEISRRFDEAVLMLHARQYEPAATALLRVLRLSPGLPEAHVNLGFALLGLQRSAEARASFERALALRPAQANAYYGLAMAAEQQGDLESALGAMRSYLHLAAPDARYQAKARSALWEWEERLGRHAPCGPAGMACKKNGGTP